MWEVPRRIRVIDFIQLPHGPWNNNTCLFLAHVFPMGQYTNTYIYMVHLRYYRPGQREKVSVALSSMHCTCSLNVAYFTRPIDAYSLCVFPFSVHCVTQMFSAVHMWNRWGSPHCSITTQRLRFCKTRFIQQAHISTLSHIRLTYIHTHLLVYTRAPHSIEITAHYKRRVPILSVFPHSFLITYIYSYNVTELWTLWSSIWIWYCW